MKKRIRISESQIGAIVRDAVNEVFRGGENSDVIIRASDRMEDKGQYERARNLRNAYKEMNNTDAFEYSLGHMGHRGGRIRTADDKDYYDYNPDTDEITDTKGRPTNYTKALRTTDRRRAREVADRIRKMNPDTKWDRDDFIAEAVRNTLSEMFRDGENYPLINKTVDRMLAKGQWGRANDLMKNYKDVNDTEDVIYDYDLVTVGSPDGNKEAYYDNVRDRMFPTMPDKEDPNDVSFLRSTDRKRARRIADRIKKINPRTGIDKNNFIYEAVRRTLDKYTR